MESSLSEVLGVMIPIVAIVGAFIMIVYLRRFENAERMSMIEKGVDPTLFTKKQRGGPSGTLRASLLFIGVGIGLFLAYFLDRAWDMKVAYFSMLFIFGGLGLGIAYVVEEKKIKEEEARKR